MNEGVLIFYGTPRCSKKFKTGPKIATRSTSGEDISEIRWYWNKNWVCRIAYSSTRRDLSRRLVFRVIQETKIDSCCRSKKIPVSGKFGKDLSGWPLKWNTPDIM